MSIWKVEVPCLESQVLRIDTCMVALGEYLFCELERMDCTMAEMGRRCGLSTRLIEKIVSRKSPGIQLATFLKIAQGLGMRASELLAEMEGGA